MYETFNGSAHPMAPREIAITAVPEDERVPAAPMRFNVLAIQR